MTSCPTCFETGSRIDSIVFVWKTGISSTQIIGLIRKRHIEYIEEIPIEHVLDMADTVNEIEYVILDEV